MMKLPHATVTKATARAISISTYQSVPVVGLGSYTPQAYSQTELMRAMGLEDNEFAKAIAAGAEIETRNYHVPAEEWYRWTSLDTKAAYFRKQAPRFAMKALRSAAGSQTDLANLDAVVTVTSSGYMMPGLAEVLCSAYDIGRTNGLRFDLVGQGCVAIISAIQMARSLIVSKQASTVGVVCSEPHAAILNPPATDKAKIIQHLLFGEGAAALILDGRTERSEGAGKLPSFIDFEQQLVGDTLEIVKVEQGAAWETTIDRNLPNTVGRVLPGVVSRLIQRHGLSISSIKHWAFHTGGRHILDLCQSGLGLSDAQMAPSFGVLRAHGNMGSGSVLFSLEQMIAAQRPEPGSLGIMISVGPGLVVGAALMRWDG